MNFRFPSDSPESKARLARAIEHERVKPASFRPSDEYLREIGHPAAPTCSEERPCVNCYSGQGNCLGPYSPATPQPQSAPQKPQGATEKGDQDAGQSGKAVAPGAAHPDKHAELKPGDWQDPNTIPPAIGFYEAQFAFENLTGLQIAYWGGDAWSWMVNSRESAKAYYDAGPCWWHAFGKLKWRFLPAERQEHECRVLP